MAVKQFKAESKRLLDLMIHSIYTNKEIFMRELISNASDAIDKMYYMALNEETIDFNRGDFFIKISVNKTKRTLTISDTGIGMSKEDLDNNLGIIAQSGSLTFKDENETHDGYDIIGQFGVGFYSAFMVADKITVISKPYGVEEAFKWESKGAEGYSVTAFKKDSHGTEIILKIKENAEDENYDIYLEEYEIKRIIKKYSDFINYPIKMGGEVINSMVPIWRKNKNELKEEDYEILYFTDEIDEFAIQMIHQFKEKEFRSVSAGENGISDSEDDSDKKLSDKEKELVDFMKEELKDKVKEVRISKRLKTHPVCLTADGALSIEMEQILNSMPESGGIKADKILEINENHEIYQSLRKLYETDREKLKIYTYILYNQALLIEGLGIEDPVELSNKICDLMK